MPGYCSDGSANLAAHTVQIYSGSRHPACCEANQMAGCPQQFSLSELVVSGAFILVVFNFISFQLLREVPPEG